jgi:AraC-like DNA-binding protein
VDLLGGVLEGLRLESTVFCHARFSAPWGFAKAALEGAPFHAVMSGQAWVILANASPIELGAGDFVVLPHGDEHRLLCAPNVAATSFTDLLTERGAELWRPGQQSGGPVILEHGGEGEVTTLVSGIFAFGDQRLNPLVAALPRVIHVRRSEGTAVSWLETTLRYLADEAATQLPGSGAVTARLADILFIQAVRAHLALHPSQAKGWLKGMTDPAIGRTLASMHSAPAKAWSVEILARDAGMSRSGFAARFKALVGEGPIEYLTRWRMHEAADRLLTTRMTIVQIAEGAGYCSEVAFSKAFKKWAGVPPASYRRCKLAGLVS